MALLTGPQSSWTSEEMLAAATLAARERDIELVVMGPNEPTEQGGPWPPRGRWRPRV
ncbi:hypothetical protein GCM10020219_073650 [Nonomuraea dietziae]